LAESEKEPIPIYRLLGLILANQALGRKREADSRFEELKARTDMPLYQVAQIYASRNTIDESFRWLTKSFEARDPALSEIKCDPLLQPLRNDPRYRALLAKIGLPL
jgi:hypothetical protein